jgi:alkylhydroperoxidase family enzyme
MEVNSAVSRADGIRDSDLAALADYASSDAFTERERAALAYAGQMAAANQVPDELFAALRRHFTDNEIVELTAVAAFEICAAKFNRALEIEGQGLCLLPPGLS